eukprot:4834472-Pleurochrysis_carterae.AAC.2
MKPIMNTRNKWAERMVSEMRSKEGERRAGGDRALAPAPPPDEIVSTYSFISSRSFELLREMNLRFSRAESFEKGIRR